MTNCGLCIYWEGDKSVNGDEGTCHRYPPTVLTAIEINLVTKMPGTKVHFIFPRLKKNGFCGEGIPKVAFKEG